MVYISCFDSLHHPHPHFLLHYHHHHLLLLLHLPPLCLLIHFHFQNHFLILYFEVTFLFQLLFHFHHHHLLLPPQILHHHLFRHQFLLRLHFHLLPHPHLLLLLVLFQTLQEAIYLFQKEKNFSRLLFWNRQNSKRYLIKIFLLFFGKTTCSNLNI